VSVRVKAISRRGTGNVEVTMRDVPEFQKKSLSLFNVGDELKGKVISMQRKRVFVDVGAMAEGCLSINNITGEGVFLNPKDLSAGSIKAGDELDVQVLKVTKNQLFLTQKGILTVAARASAAKLKLTKKLRGTVSKINKDGAELDLGLDQIGWLSIGDMSDEPVKKITDVLEVGQQVSVRVKSMGRRGTGIVVVTMRDLPKFQKKSLSLFKVGDALKGKVISIKRKRVFVDVGAMAEGYLSIDNMKGAGVTLNPKDPSASSVKPGDELEVQVLRVTQTQLTLTQKGL